MERISNAPKLVAVDQPIIQKNLYRTYKNVSGTVIIRQRERVLTVCESRNIYLVAMRLFQKGGILADYDRASVHFEVVRSDYDRCDVKAALRHLFNIISSSNSRLAPDVYEDITTQYLTRSRYDNGEHKTDTTR